MAGRVDKELLIRLRSIPVEFVIVNLLGIPNKISEGYFRFQCPECYEMNTTTYKKNNAARCFRCRKNFNPIDLVMAYNEINFLETVRFLMPVLSRIKKVKR